MGFLLISGVVFLVLILVIVLSVFHAFVIATLWRWGISPVFGLPLLTKAQAYLVGLFISYLTIHPQQNTEGDAKDKAIANLVLVIAKPLIVLTCGWIVVTFFM